MKDDYTTNSPHYSATLVFSQLPKCLDEATLHANALYISSHNEALSATCDKFEYGTILCLLAENKKFNPFTARFKSTFSQPLKEKCISAVVRIGSILIFHLSKLSSSHCVM